MSTTPIFDWYLLTIPLFTTLIILTLAILKQSLKKDIHIPESLFKRVREQQHIRLENQIKTAYEKYQVLKILKYMAENMTVLEFCICRKWKNKLQFVLSVGAIAGLSIVNPGSWINWVVGAPIVMCFFICQVCFQNGYQKQGSSSILDGQAQDYTYLSQQAQQVKQAQPTITKHKNLYIIYATLTCTIGLYICAITFKNYSNLFLSSFLKNMAINCCIDIFVSRFVLCLVLCLPCSFSGRVGLFVDNQGLRDMCRVRLEEQNGLKDCATNLSPRKKQNLSPSKIPKAVPKLTRDNSQNQALKSAIQICKKVKNQQTSKTGKNQIANNLPKLEQQYSVNHLLQELQGKDNKGRQTPIAMFGEEDQKDTSGFKTKRKDTDLVIVEFKRNQEDDDVQGNQRRSKQEQEQEQVIQKRATSFIHSNLDFEDQFNKKQKQQSQTGHASGQNRLNVIKLLNDAYQKQKQFLDQEASRQNSRANQNLLSLNIDRNNHNTLQINENQQQQIQEIDPNSPERRKRRALQGYQESSQYKLKKKAKHFNGNAKRRVIKFSSGQPYLQYLPNMLSKDAIKHKKSQPLHVRPDLQIIEDRRKSIKKSKTKKQPKFMFGGYDENQYPGGKLEAMQVQDL